MHDEFLNSPSYMNYPYIGYNKNLYSFNNTYNVKQRNEVSKEILDMIKDLVMAENKNMKLYDYILSLTVNSDDKTMIEIMKKDVENHNKILRKIYLGLTGVTLPQSPDTDGVKLDMSYIDALEKELMNVLENTQKYRKILSAIKDKDQYNGIMEIIMTLIEHSANYNYLITKNMVDNERNKVLKEE